MAMAKDEEADMLSDGKADECEGGRQRQAWSNKIEYLLAMVGNAVGIGNIWRFPYQCQKYGGGAFLIPYFTVLLLIGYPLLLMEIALGQKYQCGAVAMWGQLSPYASGIGICSLIIVAVLSSYYAVVLSWSFVYAVNSFQSPLPWKECPKILDVVTNTSVVVKECADSSPSTYYWFRVTLNAPNSIEESHGTINWQILIAVLFATILLFIGLQKGVKSTGKFMYFAVLFPYVVLLTFLIRAFTLDGALEGIAYLLRADMATLKNVEVWQAAITQIFFSVGIGYGVYVAQASYMPKGNNCYFDVIFVASANSFTSILATLIVFGVLGFRATVNERKCYTGFATQLNVSVDALMAAPNVTINNSTTTNLTLVNMTHCTREKQLDEAMGGTGLAFIAFAEAIISFPVSNLWSLIFFLMLASVGISSVMGTLTGVIASLRDIGCKVRKSILAVSLCAGLFLLTIIYTTDFGIYMIDMLDSNIGGLTLCPVVLFEVVATSYLYGINRFMKDLKRMTGKAPGQYWRLTLAVSSPVLLAIFIIGSFVNYGLQTPLTYTAWNSELASEVKVPYPMWGYAMVIFLSIVSMIAVPVAILLYALDIFDLAAYFSAHGKEKEEKKSLSDSMELQASFKNNL